MGTTSPHGIVYAESSGAPQAWVDSLNMANSIEAALNEYESANAWTPVFSNGFTSVGGAGQQEGFYYQIGKLVHAEFYFELASGFAMGSSNWLLTLPVAASAWAGFKTRALGTWAIRDDSGPNHFAGALISASVSTGVWFGGADQPGGRVTETNPVAWAIGDILSGVLDYRAA